ncbi:MAG: hypothetical protein ACP5HS_03450, partial [Anaerolineae bacterium]
GHLYVRGAFDLDAVRSVAIDRGGYAVVLRAAVEEMDAGTIWGFRPGAHKIMREIQAQWDPAGGFNRGIFTV